MRRIKAYIYFCLVTTVSGNSSPDFENSLLLLFDVYLPPLFMKQGANDYFLRRFADAETALRRSSKRRHTSHRQFRCLCSTALPLCAHDFTTRAYFFLSSNALIESHT